MPMPLEINQNEITYCYQALGELARSNHRWEKNYRLFISWTEEQRQWWINQLKRQREAQVPVAIELTTKMIEIRLRGANGNLA